MKTTAEIIEERRLEKQARLDALKSAGERNKWGQFATPPELARDIVRYAWALTGKKSAIRFLDPAVGTGSFFSALAHVVPPEKIEAASGIELDTQFAKAAKSLWGEQGLQVREGDFTRQEPPTGGFNMILTNPPYVRHHHLPAAEKDRLKERLARSLNLTISGLAGLYCYFLLLAHDWMEEGGLAAWLIPSEFMDVNYGAALRRYLTEHVTLLHIHRFCPTDEQFADALVTSAVVIFRKTSPLRGHEAKFSFGGPIERPESIATIPLQTLRHAHKWTHFPARVAVSTSNELRLGDLFQIKRGLATGSNEYFILDEDQVRDWQIPRQALKPILPGPRYVTTDVVDARPDGTPDVSPRLFLLDSSEPEERIQEKWPRFHEYLQTGKEKKIADSYLASHRAPWYSQEQRPPAPFLCTYMGRARDGKHPFRFIRNHSQATAHNVYLMLYPKGPLLAALKNHPDLAEKVFHALQRITPSQLVSEGRVYGGGLHKVEPKELAQIPAQGVLDSVEGHLRIERQETLFA